MPAFNQFLSKCERFLQSFVDEEDPSPAYERFSSIVVQRLLYNPSVPYNHSSHPFQRYGAEELSTDDAIANLAADMEAAVLQEGVGYIRLSFFAKQGFCRPDLEWLLTWFLKYADANTGVGEYDAAEWEEGDEEDEEGEEEQEDQVEAAFESLHASQPPPSWHPQLIHEPIALYQP